MCTKFYTRLVNFFPSMNNIKVKVYKIVLKEVAEKYDGAEDFTNNRIDKICS